MEIANKNDLRVFRRCSRSLWNEMKGNGDSYRHFRNYRRHGYFFHSSPTKTLGG